MKTQTYQGPALFSHGFRPFFLGGAVFAALVPLMTAVSMAYGRTLWGGNAIEYHAHEMVFGFLPAIIAGFLFTAIPNWTGRLPIAGARLGALALIWAAGRVAMALPGVFGPVATAAIDAAFFVIVAGLVWREVLAGKNWRNAPVCLLVSVFALANVAWHLSHIAGGPAAASLRAGLAIVAVLLTLIGGRVTPSFTRNWLAKRGGTSVSASVGVIDKAALVAGAVSMAAWVAAPYAVATGWLLVAAAVLHSMRLARWGGVKTLSEPLLAILHVGYLWVVASFLLLGLAALAPGVVSYQAGVHALTAGAMGVMILAVMARATRGHTGRALSADAPTILAFVMVNTGAAARVGAPFALAHYTELVAAAALLWSGAFALFVIVYGRYLTGARAGA